ncbi:MAG: tagatose 1,6-diphosphate aldolase [Deltaproteobacteria bacterium]|nr:tagatose 1,6-diphosphate aldolase [Deltaproteobacteria bacterium]
MGTMSRAKYANMNAVATAEGIIAAAAMDQRGSLQKSLAKEKVVASSAITDQMMEEFKSTVTKVLSPHASAMLLDPVWGLPATRVRAEGCGLLLAYEESGYDNTKPGRMPTLLPNWSVQKLKAHGANCCKILLYYSPFERPEINATKHEWVANIGAECVATDLPFFLEFVGYDPKGGNDKGLEFAKIKPDVVRKSMEEFDKPTYHVDVMKVEIPINLQYCAGTTVFKKDGTAYTKQEAMEHYRACAAVTTKPFIYLSAGVSDAEFRESLSLANEAGVRYNGVLCGRATWKEGIPVYAREGRAALEAWLRDRGVKNIEALNTVIRAGARPWWDAFGGKEKVIAA